MNIYLFPNFIPWRAQVRAQKQHNFLLGFLWVTVVMAIGGFLLHVVYEKQLSLQIQKNGTLKKALQEQRNLSQQLMRSQQELQQLALEVENFKNREKEQNMLMQILQDVGPHLPKGILLTRFYRSENFLQLYGKAVTSEHITLLMKYFAALTWVKQQQLTHVKQSGEANTLPLEFSIKLQIKI